MTAPVVSVETEKRMVEIEEPTFIIRLDKRQAQIAGALFGNFFGEFTDVYQGLVEALRAKNIISEDDHLLFHKVVETTPSNTFRGKR